MVIEVVKKSPDQVVFAVHSSESVVQRFFAWIGHGRLLWKEPEATLTSAQAFLYAAFIMLLVRSLRQRS